MNIKEQWKHLGELCTYWLDLDEPVASLLQCAAWSLLELPSLVSNLGHI